MDLLEKILLRLPVKELIRSKQNHNIYLHPSGFLHQINPTCVYPRKDNSLLLKKVGIIPFANNSKNRFIHLDVHDEFDGQLCYYFIRSCNGLLLWKSSPTEFPISPLYGEFLQECSFYVSNPTTGHCVRIDRFGYDLFSRFCYDINASFSEPFLAFEPWKSPHYKVIFFSKLVGATKMKVSVYSSETGSWSKHDAVPSFPNDIEILKNDGVYCNGAIHWYVLPGNYTILASLSVYFDIDRLCFKNLPKLPFTVPYNVINGAYFVECRGNLHLIARACKQAGLDYDIWELKEDYSGWIRKYNVDLTTFKETTPRSFQKFRSLSLCVTSQPPNENEEEESMLAILVVGNSTVVSYNLKDHSSTIIYQGDDGFYPVPFGGPYFLGGPYFETLVSISPGYNKL
ncbi:hypothetical protein PIB30_058814 [Stylosanthes scabra]|uniref:F-box associated beta-propeller type 1 domain-containing protein n=1 Tax=Stylosanthes scabra TaxID=79078 RepID=A0ABU6RK89_9FABA|nr:hypothetical protein [Stylosanthes scabra]